MIRNITVDVLQRGLVATGHAPGAIDGRWGPGTFAAWAAWFATVSEDDEMSLDFGDWRSSSVGWRDFGAMGVRSIQLPGSMVAYFTARAAGGPPPPVVSMTPTAPPAAVGSTGPLPPPLFTSPAPSTPSDVDAMLARLAAGASVAALAPLTGGPVSPSRQPTPLVRRRRRRGSSDTWVYVAGGVAAAAALGVVWYVVKKRR